MKLLMTILLMIGGADGYTWATLLLTPITAVIGWIAGRRQRNNTTLNELQSTIDMLVAKNSELYGIITEQNKTIASLNEKLTEQSVQLDLVRKENGELKLGQERMSLQLSAVQKENAGLKHKLDIIEKKSK